MDYFTIYAMMIEYHGEEEAAYWAMSKFKTKQVENRQ